LDVHKKEIFDAAIAVDCDVAYILINCINYFINDIDLVYKSFRAIRFLIILEETTMDLEINNNPYLFKQKLERYGIHNIMEKYENTNNDDLYQVIQDIYCEFYTEQS